METGKWKMENRNWEWPVTISGPRHTYPAYSVTNLQFFLHRANCPVFSYQLPVTVGQFPVSTFQFPVSSFHFPVSTFQLLPFPAEFECFGAFWRLKNGFVLSVERY
jgi:hypothetical protein